MGRRISSIHDYAMALLTNFLAHMLGLSDWRQSLGETHSLAGRARAFIAEAIHFQLFEAVRKDSLMCYEQDRLNATYEFIMSQLSLCANMDYFPRQLTSSQISWKRIDPAENISSESQNTSTSNSNKTLTSPSPNRSVPKPKEIIHDFLVLALLLPKHPFSADMMEMIRSTAPLYPQVVFTVTNGLEMKEFCAQYNVHSFPKLLMFKKGMLLGKYAGSHRVLDFSVQMTLWTEAFPRAVPHESKKSTRSANLTRSLPLLSSPASFSWNFLGLSATEPIKAHIENAGLFENHLFIISSIYFLFRIVYWSYRRYWGS